MTYQPGGPFSFRGLRLGPGPCRRPALARTAGCYSVPLPRQCRGRPHRRQGALPSPPVLRRFHHHRARDYRGGSPLLTLRGTPGRYKEPTRPPGGPTGAAIFSLARRAPRLGGALAAAGARLAPLGLRRASPRSRAPPHPPRRGHRAPPPPRAGPSDPQARAPRARRPRSPRATPPPRRSPRRRAHPASVPRRRPLSWALSPPPPLCSSGASHPSRAHTTQGSPRIYGRPNPPRPPLAHHTAAPRARRGPSATPASPAGPPPGPRVLGGRGPAYPGTGPLGPVCWRGA
ncbi:hypothetical protein STENM327S_03288 [Streptomyces tendae]